MSQAHRHRFRPRYRGIAAIAGVVGGALLVLRALALVTGVGATFALVGGVAGLVLAALYLTSPAWRIEVVVTDDALEVLARGDRRFRLAWGDIVRVVASPTTKTCFVDGGAPDLSLLVPGLGATAPYDIEDKHALYDAIVARAPAAVVVEVDLLETADLGAGPSAGGAGEDGANSPDDGAGATASTGAGVAASTGADAAASTGADASDRDPDAGAAVRDPDDVA